MDFSLREIIVNTYLCGKINFKFHKYSPLFAKLQHNIHLDSWEFFKVLGMGVIILLEGDSHLLVATTIEISLTH